MKKFNINLSLLTLLGFVAFYSCQSKEEEKQSRTDVLPYYNEATFTPIWLEPHSDEVNQLHTIPSFTLMNQNGQEVTEKTFEDKIYVADFFFTSCPGICPAMTKNMIILQEAFENDNDVMLLSHSVTPAQDSIPILKAYAEAQGVISDKWHLVTGKQAEIYTLGRKSYFVEEDLGFERSADEFLHTENFILVDKDKHLRGIYNGLSQTSIDQLIADIKTLKKEKE